MVDEQLIAVVASFVPTFGWLLQVDAGHPLDMRRSSAQMRVLGHLDCYGWCTVGELAGLLDVQRRQPRDWATGA